MKKIPVKVAIKKRCEPDPPHLVRVGNSTLDLSLATSAFASLPRDSHFVVSDLRFEVHRDFGGRNETEVNITLRGIT